LVVVVRRASDKDARRISTYAVSKELWRPGAIRCAKITAGKVAGKKLLRDLTVSISG
jgi:hypothetical protein